MSHSPSTAPVPGGWRRRLLRLAVPLAIGACAVTLAAPADARPPSSVTTGPISVSNVTVNAGSVNYAVVKSGGNVVVKGSYAVDEQGGSVDQIEIGWRGSSAPLGCVYSGGSGTGTFSFNLGKAPAPRLNQVIVNYAQNFSCNTNAWWSSNDGPVIADVVVTPATTGSSGPVSVSNVAFAPSTKNVQVSTGTKQIVVTGSYAIGDTGGAATQIQIGWRGAPLATTCVVSGGSGSSGTFKVNLGLPPQLGANFVTISYAQNFSCKRQWWFDNQLADSATIGAVYNAE